jgi:hypothetical protein
MRRNITRAVTALAGLATIAPLTLALSTGAANAASPDLCAGGGFKVTLTNGSTISGSTDAKVDTSKTSTDATVKVRGKYIEFDFAPVTGNITNYVYTGAANEGSMTSGVRTPIWKSKVVDLGGATLRKTLEADVDGVDLVMLARAATRRR